MRNCALGRDIQYAARRFLTWPSRSTGSSTPGAQWRTRPTMAA